jgi:hypothetical protein
MSQLKQPLPQPLPSNITYDAVLIDESTYDPIAREYRARVFGVCKGRPLPLILNTAAKLRHIEEVVVSDAEIDQVLAVRPDLNNDRVSGALAASFRRLYELAREQPEAPDA